MIDAKTENVTLYTHSRFTLLEGPFFASIKTASAPLKVMDTGVPTESGICFTAQGAMVVGKSTNHEPNGTGRRRTAVKIQKTMENAD